MRYKFYKCTRLNDIRELVQRSAKLYGSKIAFKEIGHDKQIAEYTYDQLEQDRQALGTAMLRMGMQGCHVALLSESLYAWVLGYVTVISGVGVVVPMDKELPNGDIAKLLRKSDTDVVICSESYIPVMRDIMPECPNIKTVIVMNPTLDHIGFYRLQDLLAQGRSLISQGDTTYFDQPIDTNAMCEILFTSGTTGANKGVMLCHRNIMSVVYGMMQLIHTTPVSFSVLPIHHSYECTCHVLGGIYSGLTLCFNDNLKHLMENIQVFKPGMSLMVPLFLETMYKRIWKEAEANNVAGHLKYGIILSNLLRIIGIDPRRLYFKPILDKFGGNLKQIVCGGAPLRAELIKGFDDIGINVVNGYGLSECAPVIATNSTAWKKLNSVGKVLSVCNVRIANPDKFGNGEVQIKGDTVMLGYYRDEESTRATFTEDGYLMTGDLGHLDRQGFLYLSGRKKNLIILANGKNICPEELEAEIAAQIPYVKEVMVYQLSVEQGDCISADVFIDPDYIKENETIDIKAKLNADIHKLNRRLPVYKTIQNIVIRDKAFEKTTTQKNKETG